MNDIATKTRLRFPLSPIEKAVLNSDIPKNRRRKYIIHAKKQAEELFLDDGLLADDITNGVIDERFEE